MSGVLHDEETQSTNDEDELLGLINESESEVGSSQTANDEMPAESEKGSDAGHGNRFQSKLLMLFCIRAINEGYKFYLGTELVDQCNKFDDLIFKYTKDKKVDKTGDNWSYKYLQAKSRLKEKVDKITVTDLFRTKKKSDFSLLKYFRSYREITRRGDKIDSCIICTNIDFDNKENLQENGIEVKEVQLTDPILKFEKLPNNKISKCYKINRITKEDLSTKLRKETTSKLLAKMLNSKTNEKQNSKFELIRNYHMALVDENVIDLTTKKIHADFFKESDGAKELSEGAKELRLNLLELRKEEIWESFSFNFNENFGKTPLEPQIFNYRLPVAVEDEEIVGFLDKLIFAVNTPNEDELDIILTKEVRKYYELLNTDLQSAYIMNEMVNWFKREDNVWLSSEEAKELFLNKTKKIMESIRINEISIDYQKQLKKDLMGLEFNSDAIQVMTEKLRPLLLESKSSSIIIGTESPQHTAIKLVAAIKTLPDFQCDDSFLVTSSKRLEDKVEMEKFKGSLELKKDSHILLVIVCDGEGSPLTKYANFIPEGGKDNKINKVVIICPDKTADMTDKIKYTDLTEEFQQKILSLKISFQLKKGVSQQKLENNRITVGELIGDKPEEVIDLSSIRELMQTGQEIKIPSFDDTPHFEELVYIKRKLRIPFHDKFEHELAKSLDCTLDQLHMECQINPDGKIEWLAQQGKRQKEIWEKIKDVAYQSTLSGLIDEDNHMKEDGKEKSIVIISGVAGTGKSTLLSHYYEEIKKAKPSHWVIRINFSDHNDTISELNVMPSDPVDFLVNQLNVIDDKSSFSRSLLRNRLEKGDRIVFLFDGFDEINDTCQEKIIPLFKAITKEKSSQLFVTTQPDMLDYLQFQLSQLAFSLENLSEKDQINHLISSYWKKNSNYRVRTMDRFGSLPIC